MEQPATVRLAGWLAVCLTVCVLKTLAPSAGRSALNRRLLLLLLLLLARVPGTYLAVCCRPDPTRP